MKSMASCLLVIAFLAMPLLASGEEPAVGGHEKERATTEGTQSFKVHTVDSGGSPVGDAQAGKQTSKTTHASLDWELAVVMVFFFGSILMFVYFGDQAKRNRKPGPPYSQAKWGPNVIFRPNELTEEGLRARKYSLVGLGIFVLTVLARTVGPSLLKY